MAGRTADILRGRWQAPLAVIAVGAAIFAALRLSPSAQGPDFQTVVAELNDARIAGNASAAADTAANLLAAEPAPTREEQAYLHDFIASVLYDALSASRMPSIEQAQTMLDHLQQSRRLGTPQTSHRDIRLADGLYWSGRLEEALRRYRDLLETPIGSTEKRRIARRLVALLPDDADSTAERNDILQRILDDPAAPVEEVWWALQQSLSLVVADKNIAAARALIDKYGDRLRTSDLRGYLDYLDAWVLVHEGRTAEAAPLVVWIDDWLGKQPLREDLLAQFGHLPSMNRWLMGKIDLADRNPESALQRFESAIEIQPSGKMLVAALLGKGQALAALSRHNEAQDAFAAAIHAIGASVQLEELRKETTTILHELFTQRNQLGDEREACDYLNLEITAVPESDAARRVALLETLGSTSVAAAEESESRKLRRDYFAAAGDAFAAAGTAEKLDMDRRAALQWRAAQAFDKAGRNDDLRKLLTAFIDQRSNDPRLPAAKLMLGQAYEIAGEFVTALEHYRDIAATYPKLEEAARATLLGAGCLLQISADNAPEAERMLASLLNNDYVAPDAAVFREALLSLADLLYNAERYGEAISRLEAFRERFPEDDAQNRAHFQLSDAYRLSAIALRDAAQANDQDPAAESESIARYRAALDLYAALRTRLDAIDQLRGADATYHQLATLYEADCLAALNEPETIENAILKYRKAAAEFDDHEAALVALVQIANLELRKGSPVEAARAIERARWLVRSIPEAGFRTGLTGYGREEWSAYLETMASSQLFRNVFAAS